MALAAPLPVAMQQSWAAAGVRILAVQEGRGLISAVEARPLSTGTELIVIGPAATVRSVTGQPEAD